MKRFNKYFSLLTTYNFSSIFRFIFKHISDNSFSNSAILLNFSELRLLNKYKFNFIINYKKYRNFSVLGDGFKNILHKKIFFLMKVYSKSGLRSKSLFWFKRFLRIKKKIIFFQLKKALVVLNQNLAISEINNDTRFSLFKDYIIKVIFDIYAINFLLFNVKYSLNNYKYFVDRSDRLNLKFFSELNNNGPLLLPVSTKFFNILHFWFLTFTERFALYFGKLLFVIWFKFILLNLNQITNNDFLYNARRSNVLLLQSEKPVEPFLLKLLKTL